MIPEKIQNLFQFIEYLHSNIEGYTAQNPNIDQFYILCAEKSKYYNKGYHEKKIYNKLQVEVNKVSEEINVAALKIIDKANYLGMHFIDGTFTIDLNVINTFKKNAVDADLDTIELHKSKYLEFRKKCTKFFKYFGLHTFKDLDLDLLRIFKYFSSNKEEFDFLFEKNISIKQEPINQKLKPIQQNQTKTDAKSRMQKVVKEFFFFQFYTIADLEHDGKVYKDVKQKNNDTILKPENWEANKETFFIQSLEKYPES